MSPTPRQLLDHARLLVEDVKDDFDKHITRYLNANHAAFDIPTLKRIKISVKLELLLRGITEASDEIALLTRHPQRQDAGRSEPVLPRLDRGAAGGHPGGNVVAFPGRRAPEVDPGA